MKKVLLSLMVISCYIPMFNVEAQTEKAQRSFSAEIVTSDGNKLMLSHLHYVYTESHDTGRYVNFPDTISSRLGGMEHLAIDIFCGRLFTPFHLISRLETLGKEHDAVRHIDRIKVRVFFKSGEMLEGKFGYQFNASLAGEGAFGVIAVALDKIATVTFSGEATTSRTFDLPKGRPGGPFVISNGAEKITGITLIDIGTFKNQLNVLSSLESIKVGGMTMSLDFSKIAKIFLTPLTQEPNRVMGKNMLEIILNSGERVKGDFLAGINTEPGIDYDPDHSIIGKGELGIVLVSFFKPVTIVREGIQ